MVSERFMPSFRADPADAPVIRRIHPALTGLYDEVCGTLARLFAYVGMLALLGILGLCGWRQLSLAEVTESDAKPGWTVTSRFLPAFAVSLDQVKSRTYTILRHPEGGRKDVIRWPGPTETPAIELEIYQWGGEASLSSDAIGDLADRMPPDGAGRLESIGMIDSKLGPVALFHRAGSRDGFGACLGFVKRIEEPALQLTGWSCQGEGLPARRATIGCMLNRLTLLAPTEDPKLAELFGRTEPKRASCAGLGPPGRAADWVSGVENPRLRGGF
jgi:hypothetical protein